MASPFNLVKVLHQAKNALSHQDSPVSSPSVTTLKYTGSFANDKLTRAPLKSQHREEQSSDKDPHPRGVSSKSNPHQSSFLTRRTEVSFAPSMSSSLPSVATSPPKKNTTCCNQGNVKKLPQAARAPGSLLADLYNSGGLTRPPGSLLSDAYSGGFGGLEEAPTKGNPLDMTGGRRGNGRQKNTLGETKNESVVVIDVDDEEEQAHNTCSSRRQEKSSVMSTSPRTKKTWPGGGQQVVDDGKEERAGRESDALSEFQSQVRRETDSGPSISMPQIPPLQPLNVQTTKTNRSPLKLKKSRDSTMRQCYKEKDANNAGAMASPKTVEIDDSVLYMETTSSHFDSKESKKRGGSEVVCHRKEVRPSRTQTPPTDVLTTMKLTQEKEEKVEHLPQRNFVPRRKDCSPESEPKDCVLQVPSKRHQNRFAKELSSTDSTGAVVESKSKTRLPEPVLNMTPTLSRSGFSFTTEEAEGDKRTSETTRNREVRPSMHAHV